MIDVRHGDSRDVIATMADSSVDSVVTDPPYALVQMTKRYGNPNSKPCGAGADGSFRRLSKGFMGKAWDTGDTAFDPAFWRDVMRVMKPGAHLIAFSGTRTYHRLAVAIEDAGFEIRDQIQWIYGAGFPKSHNVGKHLPEWDGWGTALKPAWEPIVLARKPLIGTVAANVLAHGTGAINVDGCRVPGALDGDPNRFAKTTGGNFNTSLARDGRRDPVVRAEGRWPANVIHDGSEEVVGAFPQADSTRANGNPNNPKHGDKHRPSSYGLPDGRDSHDYRDTGSAARFFYSAKADAGDRLGSKHPTVKPVDLMAYLCRLVTPPGGTVLDPFAGSGTTGMACMREGFNAILIEREAEYVEDIKRRIAHVKGEDAPLFGGTDAPPRNRDGESTESSRTKNRPGQTEGLDAA